MSSIKTRRRELASKQIRAALNRGCHFVRRRRIEAKATEPRKVPTIETMIGEYYKRSTRDYIRI